jgi:hypothetical protein
VKPHDFNLLSIILILISILHFSRKTLACSLAQERGGKIFECAKEIYMLHSAACVCVPYEY